MIQSLKNPSIPMRGLCSHINTSNQITQSYLILQCKEETDHLLGMVMPQKPSSTERGMPLCKVYQMKYTNHVSCSNVKKDVWSPPRDGHDSKYP